MIAAKPIGVILAGGRGTRMGGVNKGLLMLQGQSLLDRVSNRLAPLVSDLIISSNDSALPSDRLVLPDELPDWPGPLAGISAALNWAATQGHRHVVSVAADTPFFPDDLVDRLRECANPEGLCLAASVENGKQILHPTFGLWPVSLRKPLADFLTGGDRKVRVFANMHGAGIAEFSANPDPFFNINTPEDLLEAEKRLDVSGQ